ncbi:protein kinase domain-containing protein [Nocardia stercoris]|uniref:non-specific serine/threonine protein kinase n=1 Tax=Nocardia stercoris TaxID=2483361 RepID=A0A3M2KUH6_9NOCA|nr:right-handed parallel beta-helix repeat-containing protein [Nocardia stercoris]RMI29109.1 hypothetical protein EBN03_27130 [Nocardia stercoris]
MGAIGPGGVFAGFRIVRELGAGGMGQVFLAQDRSLPRYIALKVLNDAAGQDAELRARFLREADIVARLDHPNIVTVHARGEERGRLWIAMGFVDGTDVEKALRAGALDLGRAVKILTATADALDCAHDARVLHRDVKPANILLTAGPRERVVLTDFGIAKPIDEISSLTQTGKVLASFQYAAPERLHGTASGAPASDVYSLGCTLFHILTGRTPFAGANLPQLIYAHLYTPPPAASAVNPALPRGVDAVIARALAKNPADRYPTCGALAAALAAVLPPPPRFAPPVHTPPAAPPPVATRVPAAAVSGPADAADRASAAQDSAAATPSQDAVDNSAAARANPMAPNSAAATPNSAAPPIDSAAPGRADNRLGRADAAPDSAVAMYGQAAAGNRPVAPVVQPPTPNSAAAASNSAAPAPNPAVDPLGRADPAPEAADAVQGQVAAGNRPVAAVVQPPTPNSAAAASNSAAPAPNPTVDPLGRADPAPEAADAVQGQVAAGNRPVAAVVQPPAPNSAAAVSDSATPPPNRADDSLGRADAAPSSGAAVASSGAEASGPVYPPAAADRSGAAVSGPPVTVHGSPGSVTHVVDPAGPSATIGAAISSAGDGDIVAICPGTYRESLRIDKPITLVGRGSRDDVVIISADGHTIVCTAAARLENLTVIQEGAGSTKAALDIGAGSVEVTGCEFRSSAGPCVAVHDDGDPVLRRNVIRDGSSSGIAVFDGGRGTFEANRIHGQPTGVLIASGATPVLRENTIEDVTQFGVLVEGEGTAGVLERNELHGARNWREHASVPLTVRTGANPVVRHNTVRAGDYIGVRLTEGALGLLADNRIEFGDGAGDSDWPAVCLESGAGSTLRRNTVADPRQRRNGRPEGVAGAPFGVIYIADETTTGLLEDNTVRAHLDAVALVVKYGAHPTVRHNDIRGGSTGVLVGDADTAGLLEHNTLTEHDCAIAVLSGAHPTVRHNTIRANGVGIDLLEGAPVIESNTLSEHREAAVRVYRHANPALRRNTIRANTGYGIWIAAGGAGTVEGNTLTGHDHEPAVHLEPGATVTLDDNVLHDNAAGDVRRL